HRDPGAAALRVGDAAPADVVASLAFARRWPAVPAELLRPRFDQANVARVLDVLEAEFDRVLVERRRHFVDERFAGEMDLRADRIAPMRRATARGEMQQ